MVIMKAWKCRIGNLHSTLACNKTGLETEVVKMFQQHQEYINYTINQRCNELKEEAAPYIEYTLYEILEQLKIYERTLLYRHLDNGSLKLPDEGYEIFVWEFILDNEKMALDTLLVHKAEEFLERQALK